MFPTIVSFPRLFSPEMSSTITIFVATIFSEGMFTMLPYFLKPMLPEATRDSSHFGADPWTSIIARTVPISVHVVVIKVVVKKEIMRYPNCDINPEPFIINHFRRCLKFNWRWFIDHWRGRNRLITKMNIEAYLSLNHCGGKTQAK
ncbi:MAG: hypothetical protein HYR80_06890 [Nitrospirae bacterium]|nr:hypothetical protein [Nitrospirota bacterium]